MPGSKIVRRRTEEANQQGWKCFWCEIPMTPAEKNVQGVAFPPTMVTLDHLFHKSDPRRQVPCRGEKRYVAACRSCNEKRGADDERAIGLAELRRRSTLGRKRRALQKTSNSIPVGPAEIAALLRHGAS